jgi:hypothetical protein
VIDITCEQLKTPAEAAKYLSTLLGRRVHQSTIWRWMQLQPNALEGIQIGRVKYTSVEALQRFFEASTARANPGAPGQPPAPMRSAAERKRASERAARKLIEKGA